MNSFWIDGDDKILYWTPVDKKIPMTATSGKFYFLALSSLATKYGVSGTVAVRRSVGLNGYTSKTSRSSSLLREHSDRQTKPLVAALAILRTSNSRTSLA